MSDPAPTNDNQTQSMASVWGDEAHDVIHLPGAIGRYRVDRLLGRGGFGLVFLAHDEQLDRPVAIKVAHSYRVARATDVQAYLSEARTVANLDHPNIVPVHDVGSTEHYPCYIVSKYIPGCDLATRLRTIRFSIAEGSHLVAIVCEALHYAHSRGVIHRDIKPGNILLDTLGKPYVVDFGLALKEGDGNPDGGFAGTPGYMSPEQARGEGHRVDGRSDIFSLGVVLYELITARRPFGGKTYWEILDCVKSLEARPPRQFNDTIPKDLERICLKALSKRATERYTTAHDLADDLRHFLASATDIENAGAGLLIPATLSTSKAPFLTPVITRRLESRPLQVVPKGLRSFDEHDADFFLELVPGPRDREGLPDSIRFWKAKIEELDPDKTFSVGMIYGPSGCGKSSLVKAGLLPRLSDHVSVVYVEATADQTKNRLIHGIARRCAKLPGACNLREICVALRRGTGLLPGEKILLVLDQFEQWLHSTKEDPDTELLEALRQCDGGHLQCLVLVRDDFWMTATRFMQELEVPLLEGHNSAAVDLFPIRHAEKVLAAFGRAFGVLPAVVSETTKLQYQFLEQASQGLAQEGKVISVRLALFAEMMKGKPWTPTTLQQAGGTKGVGVTFLEETFSASTAPPQHRVHQKAAQAVLKTLLPESGTDIKGQMRSEHKLLLASGYENRTQDFAALLRVLDRELRLITPTDPSGRAEGSSFPAGEKYYQLTHDYLVPSLREWLARRQKETRRGRAEIRLDERTRLWQIRKEKKQLPSWSEWLNILAFAKPSSEAQRQMLRQATIYHLGRTSLLLLVVVIAGLTAREFRRFLHAKSSVQQLLTAEAEELPFIFSQLASNRHYAELLLQRSYDVDATPRQKQNVELALADINPDMLERSFSRLLESDLTTSLVIGDLLSASRHSLTPRLWQILEDPERELPVRFRSALALAKYDPPEKGGESRWHPQADVVARQLIATAAGPPNQYVRVIAALKPARIVLLPALCQALRDHSAAPQTVVSLLSEYADDQPEALCRAALYTQPPQFQQLVEMLRPFKPVAVPCFQQEVAALPGARPNEKPSSELFEEKVRAVVALSVLNGEQHIFEQLRHQPNPELRSRLIRGLHGLGVDVQVLVRGLSQPIDVSVLRALLMAIGSYDLNSEQRDELVPKVKQVLGEHPDAGVHSAAEWLLRKWKEDVRLPALVAIPAEESRSPRRSWLVNAEGHTLAVVDASQQPQLKRQFAIGTTEVSVRQFQRFRAKWQPREEFAPTPDCPGNLISWFDAAAYCNWLSKKEGLAEDQLCYREMNGELREYPDFAKRSGYRLPTVAEWKFATLAGAKTPRFFGNSDELMSEYAWISSNSQGRMWPGGLLKPNDWGLFDVYGNAMEWCNDGTAASRNLMGGSARAGTAGMNTQEVGGYAPNVKYYSVGFRIACTIPNQLQETSDE